MAAVEQLLVRIDATTEQLRREMRRAEQATAQSTGRMERSLRGFDRSIDSFNRRMTQATRAVQVFASAMVVRQLTGFARETLQTARSLQEQSDKLGLSTRSLQEYRFAAGEVGVAQNTLDMALQRFTRRVGEAQQGTGELLPVLEQYNVQLRTAEGRTRSVEAVLMDLADAAAGAESQQEALRISFKAFDSEGAALVNLLRRGSVGIAEFSATATRLGLVLDDAMIQSMGDTAREIDTLNAVLRTNVQQGLMSGLATDADEVRGIMSDPALIEGFRALGEVGGSVLRLLADEARTLVEQLTSLEGLFEGSVFGRLNSALTRQPDLNPDRSMEGALTGPLGGPFATGAPAAALTSQGLQLYGQTIRGAVDRPAETAALFAAIPGDAAPGVMKTAEALKEQEAAAKRAQAALDAVANQTRQLGLETAVATDEMTEIEAVLAEAENTLRTAGVSGAQLETALVDLGVALEESEAATGEATKALEDFDDTMADLAQQTQVLKGAMTASEAAAADLRRTLEEAGVGAEEAAERAEAFKRSLDLKEAAETAKRQLEEYEEEFKQTIEEIEDEARRGLGDAFYRTLRDDHTDYLEFVKDTFFRTIADIAAQAATQQIVVPIATRLVGAAPSFFGLGQAPAGAAGGGGGGLLGSAGDLLGIGRGLFGGGAGGFMNTPIFSSLPSGFVGPPAAGQVFTIGNALGGLGIGAGVGGLVSGLTGGNSLAGTGLGAGLGLVGTAIGGPIGGIVGGAVGGLLGGLFGPGKSVGPNALAGIDMQDGMFLGLPGAANNGGSAAAAAEAAQGLADALNILVAMTGATPTGWLPGGVFLGDFPSKGGAHVSVGNVRTLAGMEAIYGPASSDPHSGPRGNIAFFLGEQTTAAAVQAALLQTELEGLSEGFETIIASVTRTRMSLEEIEQAFQFGQVYDAVVAAERPLSNFQAAMESLVESFEDGLRRAADLSLSTEDFAAGTRRTFDRDTRDAILQITDPLAFAMEVHERDTRARLEAAIKIGADITQVEELIGLERAAIIQQAAGASFAGLRETIDRALSGDAVGGLSPLSPKERLEEAQREFDRLVELGLAGDAEAAQQATRQRDVLLQMADGVYASSSDFADVFAESAASLESLKGAFNDVAAVGEATSDFVARLLAEIEAAGVAPIAVPTPVPLPPAVTERTPPPPRARSIPRRPPFPTGGGEAGPSSSDMRRYREEVEAYYRAIGQTPPAPRPSRQERAMGGPVFGPGGPTDDLIPAMLSNGEFVVRAAAAERIGMENLAMMNATGAMPMAGGDNGETANEVRQLRQDLRAVAGGLLEIAEEGVRQGGESARTGQRMLRQLQGINRSLIERG